VKAPVKAAQPTKEPAKQPPKPKPARKLKVNPNAKFPEPVLTKKLWASNDFRGKQAPKIEFDKWLVPEAPREGKVVVMVFLSTWSEPGKRMLADLRQWHNKYGDEIAVTGMMEETEDKSNAFVLEHKIEFPVALDRQKRNNRALGVETMPYALVISSDGIGRWQGYPLSDEERLTDDLIKQIVEADRALRAKTAADEEKAKNPKATDPKPKEVKPRPAPPKKDNGSTGG
jgi:peroxiredoxin